MDECSDDTCISGKVMQSKTYNTYSFCNPVTLHEENKIDEKVRITDIGRIEVDETNRTI